MAEAKRIRVYYEGDDDRVILEINKAGGLLPENWEIAKRSKSHGGKEGMVHELAALLRFARDPRTYAMMTDFHEVPHEKAMQKLMDFAQLLRNNHIPICSSKRILHLLRAITDFRPSSAVFVERLVGKALQGLGKELFRPLFQPLIDDLDEAARILAI